MPFDGLIFTGGTETGKTVAQAAAKNLVPCILELGGSNPAVVDASADLELAGKRLVQGRFTNSGQICLCPDYVLVHANVFEKLKEIIVKYTKQFYGNDASKNFNFGRQIHPQHANRVMKFLEGQEDKIIYQAGTPDPDNKFVPPTILEKCDDKSDIMNEETFGPLLVLRPFNRHDEVINFINERPRPLAIYFFGDNNATLKKNILLRTRSGQLVTNDTVLQYAQHNQPFGGVGDSGYGAYHGLAGFDTFSHLRSVVERPNNLKIDVSERYPNSTSPEERLKTIRKVTFLFELEPANLICKIIKILAFIFFLLCWRYNVVAFPLLEPYVLGFLKFFVTK